MGIQLLSISHKTTPMQIRSLFVFDENQKLRMMSRLTGNASIEEAVVLSTCNRTEIYCSGTDETDAFLQMQKILIQEAHAEEVMAIGDYLLRYRGESAIHHLFQVAAGLDSMVIGEDQILGQVKQAHETARVYGFSKTVCNTLFRYAVTGAKKVKTDTLLSKTSVSTTGLALKEAEKCLGSLDGKKLMVIGGSGKIGGIVLKNAADIKGLTAYATMRNHMIEAIPGKHFKYQILPYEKRYEKMDEMDVILSATTSPHYTVTKHHFLENQKSKKMRVFLDLALPADIEKEIGGLQDTFYYSIEDVQRMAQQNNEKKQACMEEAEKILKEYEEAFLKWILFWKSRDKLEELKHLMVKEAEEKGMETAVNHLFYHIREEGTIQELDGFLTTIEKVIAPQV